MTFKFLAALFGPCLISFSASAAFSMNPLSTFGGGDGWLSPTEYPTYLTTSGDQRSIAFGNGHVYLQSGTASAPIVRILDALTGSDIGQLTMTGVSGGTRALTGLGVGIDGAIYGCNLTVANSTTSPFKVYRWANESAAPTTAFSGVTLAGARIGDSFDAFGSDSGTRVVAGYGNSPAITGNNGYAIVDPNTSSATHINFGSLPAAGDFRLGLTFGADTSSVIGDQGGSLSNTRLTSWAPDGTGTLLGTIGLTAMSERQMDFTIINGLSLLATVEATTGSGTGSTVRIYDLTDPLAPIFLGSGKTSTSANANGNGSGGVAWGAVTDNGDGTFSANLYAMNSNNGLQAFVVVIPEPGSAALALCGLVAIAFRRRLGK